MVGEQLDPCTPGEQHDGDECSCCRHRIAAHHSLCAAAPCPATPPAVARGVQKVLQDYRNLQDIIAILGMDELSEEVST